MALPKYKTSRANTHSRRANWKAKAAQTVTCPNCGAPLDLNATAKCQYCGAVIQSADFDWVLKTIKGISQQTSGR